MEGGKVITRPLQQLIDSHAVFGGPLTFTCCREPYFERRVSSRSAKLSSKKRQRFGPTIWGVAQAGSRQYNGKTLVSSHAAVSAALSWTRRFLRNQTAVLMALADAKDARRWRSGGVVMSVCSLRWLMRSLLSVECAASAVLSLQSKQLGVRRLTSEYFARVIPTNRAASAPHRGLK